jgi:hypothetical protein
VLPVKVDYTGTGYGFGLTPALGYKGAFAIYDMNWTWSTLDLQKTSTRMFNHGPRVGASFGSGGLQGALYVGAMHQSLALRQQGTIPLIGGFKLGYDVVARPVAAWNWLLGGAIVISRHLTIDIEQGFGDRSHTVAALGARF